MKLKIAMSTVLKQSPVQSSELAPEQKQSVAAGNEFDLRSYERTDGNHIKVVFGEAPFQGKDTWYVFGPHVEIVEAAPAAKHPTLTITADTILKQRPVQSAELPPTEKQSIAAGTTLPLHSYQIVTGNHIKVALAHQSFQGKNTWYVFAPHTELVDTRMATAAFHLKATVNTVLKQRPVQSAELSEAEKYSLRDGAELALKDYQPASGNHIQLVLSGPSIKDHSTWYAFAPHVDIVNPQGTQVSAATSNTAPPKRVSPPRRLNRDQQYDVFFKLIQENQGQITVMQFAMATRLSGDKAREYLDKQAVEFNANFDVDEQGNITYLFDF